MDNSPSKIPVVEHNPSEIGTNDGESKDKAKLRDRIVNYMVPTAEQLEDPNPLLRNRNLKKIFNILSAEGSKESFNTLFTCRLVCRSWSTAASAAYRERDYKTIFVDGNIFKSFISAMDGSEILPISKFHFGSHFFTREVAEVFPIFLTKWTSSITALHMNLQDVDYAVFKQNWSLPHVELENLEDFSFWIKEEQFKESHGISNFMVNIIRLAIRSKLKSFGVYIIRKRLSIYTEDHQMYNFVCSNIPKSVESLTLQLPMTNQCIAILTSKRLTLKSLNIKFAQAYGTYKFMSTQASTLEMLKFDVRRRPDEELDGINIPIFTKVTRLVVGRDGLPGVTLRNFPALQELVMLPGIIGFLSHIDPEAHVTDFFPDDPEFSCNSLTSVAITFCLLCCHRHMLRQMAQCSSNIKKLFIVYRQFESMDSTSALLTIFDQFSAVQELKILFTSAVPEFLIDADSILTGLSQFHCDTLRRYGICINENGQIEPNITNLKQLKTLVISTLWNGYFQEIPFQLCLSDVTAYYAFLKMDNLKVIQTEKYQLSEDSIRFMKKKKKKIIIDRRAETALAEA